MIKLDFEKKGFEVIQNNPFNLNKFYFDENFDSLYSKYRDNNWKNVAVLNSEKIENYKNINEILEKIFEILNYNQIINLKFENLWIVKSSKLLYKKNELPNIPHIDKERFFKVMIYLNEVELSNGPIHFNKDLPSKYEKLRCSLPKDYKSKKMNVISDVNENEFIPCIGNFGTTIFFDTNTPHFAGEIKNFSTRKILRFNFRFS